jgi:hypothetical protein
VEREGERAGGKEKEREGARGKIARTHSFLLPGTASPLHSLYLNVSQCMFLEPHDLPRPALTLCSPQTRPSDTVWPTRSAHGSLVPFEPRFTPSTFSVRVLRLMVGEGHVY